MSESDITREKIIVAARERFSHYGYPKTTIAELAEDCAMSPGNIYRFFKGKIDIAVEIARREALSAHGVPAAPGRRPSRRRARRAGADAAAQPRRGGRRWLGAPAGRGGRSRPHTGEHWRGCWHRRHRRRGRRR